jgi:hypothetical protein
MSPAFIYLFGLAGLAILVIALQKKFSGPSFMLRHWARDNGYEILESHLQTRQERGQYERWRVRIRNAQGIERSGLVHCHLGWGKNDKFEVKWDDEQATTSA